MANWCKLFNVYIRGSLSYETLVAKLYIESIVAKFHYQLVATQHDQEVEREREREREREGGGRGEVCMYFTLVSTSAIYNSTAN